MDLAEVFDEIESIAFLGLAVQLHFENKFSLPSCLSSQHWSYRLYWR
jgi:hypothetical protein